MGFSLLMQLWLNLKQAHVKLRLAVNKSHFSSMRSAFDVTS